ncbi:Uu.00g056350.m01.CDS01 [Anthostomella pinea]|uniref:Uu.00g056350.m01.CDS01 n=1 Tax=Anthostomella pinea TaxID=933095 RepID=A0AAI8VRH5_9PEZI|nr:Uu.00g056350.m01.CDS01 [Anthostomella pinea]
MAPIPFIAELASWFQALALDPTLSQPDTTGNLLLHRSSILERETAPNWVSWPPDDGSIAFWVGIFVAAPLLFVLATWVVWHCLYGTKPK